MVEFAGRLSERVRFERRMAVRGSAGERDDAWLPAGVRWARVEPIDQMRGSAILADTRHSVRRWRVTVRSGLQLDLDMRLVWRGLALQLTSIIADPALPGLVVLTAEDRAA